MTRICPRCKQELSLELFSKHRGNKSGVQTYCKKCYNGVQQEWRKRNPQKHKNILLWHHHTISLIQFNDLLIKQDFKCAVCRTNEPGGRGIWHVDHDHRCCGTRKRSCGKCIRGLLCSGCNWGLGNFKDDPSRLRDAASYIEKHMKEDTND